MGTSGSKTKIKKGDESWVCIEKKGGVVVEVKNEFLSVRGKKSYKNKKRYGKKH